jgi:deoxyribodipyrimidine photolyase-related protein
MKNLCLILGNQLFDPKILKKNKVDQENTIFFMREDRELASYYKFHKHKIVFFFAAMRSYREELISHGYNVHYEEFEKAANKVKNRNYENSLADFIVKNKITNAFVFEIEDKFFEKRIIELFQIQKVPLTIWQSPMFLTSREQFKTYLKSSKKPFMKNFYEGQRKRLNILVTDNKPDGGAWSFDTDNRLALPKNIKTPPLAILKKDEIILEVSKLVDKNFADHVGNSEDFWLPVSRPESKIWLKSFLSDRLCEFGPYEDAIPAHSEFLYHSVLTPFLNSGLLTPDEVIKETLSYAKKNKIPLGSLEGFIRQIIGWREFIRGIYQNYSEKQDSTNFWNHQNKLSPNWYKGDTGIPPLDETLRRVILRGYAHHIERLMILGSLMLLLEIEPKEAHRWFMELFIDSSDWVMGPNVYGMALFSDGGIFATKPYICGSNYLRKMGGYAKGEWCDGVDGLYWQFIRKHEKYFLKNPRLAMMVRTCQKISKERWLVLDKAANKLRMKLVIEL